MKIRPIIKPKYDERGVKGVNQWSYGLHVRVGFDELSKWWKRIFRRGKEREVRAEGEREQATGERVLVASSKSMQRELEDARRENRGKGSEKGRSGDSG